MCFKYNVTYKISPQKTMHQFVCYFILINRFTINYVTLDILTPINSFELRHLSH